MGDQEQDRDDGSGAKILQLVKSKDCGSLAFDFRDSIIIEKLTSRASGESPVVTLNTKKTALNFCSRVLLLLFTYGI